MEEKTYIREFLASANMLQGLHHRIDYAHEIDDRKQTITRVLQGSHVMLIDCFSCIICSANRDANVTLASLDDFRKSR